jgi:hypothetical protein
LTTFQNLVNGVHDFNGDELKRLHEAAEVAKAAMKAANDREQKRLGAKA